MPPLRILLLSCFFISAGLGQTANELWSQIDAHILQSVEVPTGVFMFADSTNGILHQFEKGINADTAVSIASATKFVFATLAMRLVELNIISLTDTPSMYIPLWTDDPADPRSLITVENLLSFTSGLNGQTPSCIENSTMQLMDCIQQIYDQSWTWYPGNYSYGGVHMHVLGAMILEATQSSNINQLMKEHILDPLGIPLNCFLYPPATNPRFAGGLFTSATCWNQFAHAVFSKSTILEEASFDAMLVDRTEDAVFRYSPAIALNQRWHYGFGTWIQCFSPQWDQSCEDLNIYAASGGSGTYSWMDYNNNYYGVFWRGDGEAIASIQFILPMLDDITAAVHASRNTSTTSTGTGTSTSSTATGTSTEVPNSTGESTSSGHPMRNWCWCFAPLLLLSLCG